MQRNLQLHWVDEWNLFRHDDKPKAQREKVVCNQGFRILQTLKQKKQAQLYQVKYFSWYVMTFCIYNHFTYMFQDNISIKGHL